jgi:hypothetical protein
MSTQINIPQIECLKRKVEEYFTSKLDEMKEAELIPLREKRTDVEDQIACLFKEYDAYKYDWKDRLMIKWGRKVNERSEVGKSIVEKRCLLDRLNYDIRNYRNPNIVVMGGIKADIDTLILDGYEQPLSVHLYDYKKRIDVAIAKYKVENKLT